jgi:hypothetical protein
MTLTTDQVIPNNRADVCVRITVASYNNLHLQIRGVHSIIKAYETHTKFFAFFFSLNLVTPSMRLSALAATNYKRKAVDTSDVEQHWV